MDKKQAKVGKVMREFKEGKLKSSSGQKVTNPKQAIAIGLSEAKLSKPQKMKEGGTMKRMESKGEHAVQKKSKRGAEMVKMAGGGLTAGHKSADGCAVKGKTKGKQVTMKKGGYC